MDDNDKSPVYQSSGLIIIAGFILLIMTIALLFVVDKQRDAIALARVNDALDRQSSFNSAGRPYYSNPTQPGTYPAGGYYPQPVPMQQIALNTLSLPIGVTLAGKGSVVSVISGSKADQAGILIGDIINRINGR